MSPQAASPRAPALERLGPDTLAALPAAVQRPGFDRSRLCAGIVHLGLGAFARAHLLPVTDAAIAAAGDLRWGVVGVSLRHAETRDALAPQQGLYTLALREGTGLRLQVPGCLLRVLVAAESIDAVLAQLAAPETRIVSLTITEKGYHADSDGAADLIARALLRRRDAGLGGFTALSCDNLPANGRMLRRLVRECAARRSAGLADWIDAHGRFPCTMVDRIVPRTTDTDRREVAAWLGVHDAWPVIGEPFLDWVIEDDFAAGRPDWSAGGARFVADAAPYEQLKLRMVNASHSALAYLGSLAGLETVDQAIAWPPLGGYVDALLRHEAQPTLPPLPGLDLDGYRRRLMARFANPGLRHRLLQIAGDGSQKIPQRWLATLSRRIAAGQPFECLALAVAGWLRFIDGFDEQGRALPLDDPRSDALRAARRRGDGGAGDALLFGELASSGVFVDSVARASQRLATLGVAGALSAAATACRA